jgi:hypothetical protein
MSTSLRMLGYLQQSLDQHPDERRQLVGTRDRLINRTPLEVPAVIALGNVQRYNMHMWPCGI